MSLLLLGVGGKGAAAAALPPTITSGNTASNTEMTVLAHALTANVAVTWSIVGGADSARFEISGSTLRWLGNGVKDYEAPDDADTNNAYIVQVRATDGGALTADQTITVTVTDVVVEEPWALVNSWTFSTNVAQVDFTGLAGYSEVRVLLRMVSASTGGDRQLRVSIDNGSTFLSASGDYINIDNNGVETNATAIPFYLATASSSTRSGEVIITGWNLTTNKPAQSRTMTSAPQQIVIPTANALNALRIINSSGGNLTAGSIYVWAR